MSFKRGKEKMAFKEIFYPESRFGGFTDLDGSVVFYTRVNALLVPEFTVLDVGCGRGAHTERRVAFARDLQNFKGKVKKVIGIDVDEGAKTNASLDEFSLITGDQWDVEKNSVDLLICDNVLEHLEKPELFFSEARRVLKNHGFICIRTPNTWSYVAIISKLIPNKYHSKITNVVQGGRKEEDVFPTLYRCNSLWTIRSALKKNGFRAVVYGGRAILLILFQNCLCRRCASPKIRTPLRTTSPFCIWTKGKLKQPSTRHTSAPSAIILLICVHRRLSAVPSSSFPLHPEPR